MTTIRQIAGIAGLTLLLLLSFASLHDVAAVAIEFAHQHEANEETHPSDCHTESEDSGDCHCVTHLLEQTNPPAGSGYQKASTPTSDIEWRTEANLLSQIPSLPDPPPKVS